MVFVLRYKIGGGGRKAERVAFFETREFLDAFITKLCASPKAEIGRITLEEIEVD